MAVGIVEPAAAQSTVQGRGVHVPNDRGIGLHAPNGPADGVAAKDPAEVLDVGQLGHSSSVASRIGMTAGPP
jgi:hypothetical protein